MGEKLYKIGVGFGVILLKDNKILFGLRSSDPAKADSELHGEGTWTLPGGKLDYKESFEAGVAREALEETGIKIDQDSLELVSLTCDIVHDAHFVTAGFICTKFDGEAQTMEPDEIVEWKWFDRDNLPENMYSASKNLILAWESGVIWKK